ncbi:hypothetical protein BJV82DRAFT_405403 [Fennellomyces sp. T-0311]|nr:hypothetical protein BJV82DRAFT_405403 [Fennellomyces sp. T-0311]
MPPSSSLHLLSDKQADELASHSPAAEHAAPNVHGWLMGVHPYPEDTQADFRRAKGRPLSIASISSEDSVNLDELIKANYASDMDDETDLPDLADLDLDDSDEEFWKMDESSIASHNLTPPMKPTPVLRSPTLIVRQRSGSISSENSMTSQSTVTYRSHLKAHPRASTSTSSHSTATSGSHHLPRPNIPSPAQSRSFNTNAASELPTRSSSRIGMSSKLAKRASHIPAPSSSRLATPTPQRTLSTRSSSSLSRYNSTSSTTRESSLMPTTTTRTNSRLGNRASHIPSSATSRARSPMSMFGGASGPRNSVFGAATASRPPSQQQQHHISPRSTASTTRSTSRIGMAKRAY